MTQLLESLPNVILFTRGTKGDLYPFLRIGCEFRERGCKVTLISNYCYEDYARQERFDFSALDNKELFDFLNNMPELHTNLSAKLKLSKDHMIANLERELSVIEHQLSQGRTVIVAHSNDYLVPLLAVEKFNVSLYLFMLAPSYVHSFSLFEALLISLSDELNDIRYKIGLEPVKNWKEWLNNYKKCFAVWPDWFSDEAKNIIPDLEHIGFLSIDSVEKLPLQEAVKNFIGSNTKNILITHGTSKPFNDSYFKLGIDVCQKLGYKLIVSTPFREFLPEQLPENVFWVEFCSFHELLPLIDLIIHHGGIGTTRESIANEIPQLIIGQGFDRQHNGRIVKKLGLGDWINPKALTEDAFNQKIKSLLASEDIKLQCEQLKSSLYDQENLDGFYDAIIMNTESVKAQDGRNAFGETRYAIDAVPKERRIDDISTANGLNNSPDNRSKIINKEKLLLQILKNRSGTVIAKSDRHTSGGGK